MAIGDNRTRKPPEAPQAFGSFLCIAQTKLTGDLIREPCYQSQRCRETAQPTSQSRDDHHPRIGRQKTDRRRGPRHGRVLITSFERYLQYSGRVGEGVGEARVLDEGRSVPNAVGVVAGISAESARSGAAQ